MFKISKHYPTPGTFKVTIPVNGVEKTYDVSADAFDADAISTFNENREEFIDLLWELAKFMLEGGMEEADIGLAKLYCENVEVFSDTSDDPEVDDVDMVEVESEHEWVHELIHDRARNGYDVSGIAETGSPVTAIYKLDG